MSRKHTRPAFSIPRRLKLKAQFLPLVLKDEALGHAAKSVIGALMFTFDNNNSGRCDPGSTTLAAACGISRKATVIEAIRELEKHGYVQVERRQGRANTNRFWFNFDLLKGTKNEPIEGETVRQTVPLKGTFSVSKGTPNRTRTLLEPSALKSARCVIEPAAPAPVGAALEEKKKSTALVVFDGTPLADNFEALCLIWCKPDGIDSVKAPKAFQAICKEHAAEDILASAHRWVAMTKPRYLPKLEDWLRNGAWQTKPVDRSASPTARRVKEDPAEAMARAGGWEFE